MNDTISALLPKSRTQYENTAAKTYKFSVPTGQTLKDPHTGALISSTSVWLFLKIETDAGISGWGEGSGEWLVPVVEAYINEAALLIDRDRYNTANSPKTSESPAVKGRPSIRHRYSRYRRRAP